ncbi:MAG: efflux RND transporter periplasmic adaptor subunit [Planctomycetota bacterium]|nr:efflux RND transporter periplasmic adaptor subunit [Planctomycetota bacterium]
MTLVFGLATPTTRGASRIESASHQAQASVGTTPGTPGTGVSFEQLTDRFGGHKSFTRPSRDTFMGFSLPTVIREIMVKSGQSVRKGELLIRGDEYEDVAILEQQKNRAASKAGVVKQQAALELQELEYAKLKDAFDRGAGNQQEVDRARLSVQAAKADLEASEVTQRQEEMQVDRLSARVDRYRITAPFDGVIDTVAMDLGQSVNEAEKIVRIVVVDPLWIDAHVPTDETVRLKTKPGDSTWVLMEVGGEPRVIEAKVIEVAPTADFASRKRRIRLELSNPTKGEANPLGELVAGEPAWVRLEPPPEGWDAATKLGSNR